MLLALAHLVSACASPEASIALIHNSAQGAAFSLRCSRCVEIDVRSPQPWISPGVDVVIVSGHSLPRGEMLDIPPHDLVAIIAAVAPAPRLLVLDTCYGANTEFLLALAAGGVAPKTIVGPASKIPRSGLRYGVHVLEEDTLDVHPSDIHCCRDGSEQSLTILREGYAAELSRAREELRQRARRCDIGLHPVRRSPMTFPLSFGGAHAGPIEGTVVAALEPGEWCADQCGPDPY